jgi:hypothetical protein
MSISYRFVEFDKEITQFEDLKVFAPSLISASYCGDCFIKYETYKLLHRLEQRPPQEAGIILVLLQSLRKVLNRYVIPIQVADLSRPLLILLNRGDSSSGQMCLMPLMSSRLEACFY